MSKRRLYCFWRYDLPPYLLGAEVAEKRDDGAINPKGYGMWLTQDDIMVIVPYKEGVELQKKLDKAAREYKESITKARRKLNKRVDKILSHGK